MLPPGSKFPRMSVAEVAAKVGGRFGGDGSKLITGLASLNAAGSGDLVFLSNEKYAPRLNGSRATAALVSGRIATKLPAGCGVEIIMVDDADIAFAALLELAAPPPPAAGLPPAGIHPSASVDPSARIGSGASIGAHCVVGPRVEIGSRTVLYPNVTVFDGARIGVDCFLWSGVVLRENCVVGDRCVIHANAVIGADGFGYRHASGGKGVVKIPHVGAVRVGHDVEIGSNSCIDRGKLEDTVIGDFCKIDNLCQIGHNSRLGRGVIVAGKVGISGSVTIGDGVMIGGGAGVADHVNIGAGAAIAAAAGVMRDVPAGVRVSGIPAREIKQFFREQAAVARLPEILRATPRVAAAGQDPGVAPPPLKSFQDWLDELNRKTGHKIVIRDYDGLDRTDLQKSLRATPMTEREFQRKLARCTFNIKV